ncbi:hypothetical protein D0S48_08520 [Psychrobacillus sp. AK 1817]|uniref:hypothetical protein n=1 Tax=Psychrobacillus sp. AK 1817 TaxID=2303505 RepID=UPI0012483FA6|nr:hypothetical protein [Psychrobacillus sp. AK 1817]QEY20738.1 hypothetical protein D0S48_08520 [Psychrobacillus sp. AK 1817]
MNKWLVIGISIIVSTFVAANAILLFSDKSEIARSYYLKDHERVNTNTYAKELEKESLVVPTDEITVTVDAEQVSNIMVKEGEEIAADSELAQLKQDSAEEQRAIWETEIQAYMQEQSQLQQIIGNLESEKSSSQGSYSDTDTTTSNEGNDVTDVNVQVDVQLKQDGSYAQAIAAAEQKLADIERQMQIINAQLSQETGAVSVLSPIAGTIASVENLDGKYKIDIYSQEKSLLTFVPEKEWHELEKDQPVRNYSSHSETVVEGGIITKNQVPTNSSPWLSAYKQFDSKAEEPLYGVMIQPTGEPVNLPFAANMNSVITTAQTDNAVKIKSDWLLNPSKEKAELYILTEEGKIARTAVTIPFYLDNCAILSGLESGMIVLEKDTKTDKAPAFLPFPLEAPSWNSIKAVSWKDYLKYLTYK